MKRSACSLLIATFLAVQIVSLLHVAQFNFETHQHNGQACAIYIHEKDSGSADVPLPPALREFAVNGVHEPRFETHLVAREVARGASPRAPPKHLLV